MTRKFIIDTDAASDDATALIMAMRYPGVKIEAITIVSGNVTVNQAATNALYTMELCNCQIPVYRGAQRPLLRPPVHAYWFHGQDGMSNRNYPAPQQAPEALHAVDALIETIKAHPGIELVTLGPLTNIALAVSRAPEIASLVSRHILMGGAACTEGNVTPAAEYNIWVDPEAARVVFHSGLPIEMVGWEHSRGEAVINAAEIAHIRSLDTPLAHFVIDCNQSAIEAFHVQTGEDGMSLPDPIAMAVALDPTVCTHKSLHHVDVETKSDLTRGATVVDRLRVGRDERNLEAWGEIAAREPHVSVCWQLDFPRWKQILYGALV